MLRKSITKLFAYVDESGQDSAGCLFVVSVLVVDEARDTIGQQLEDIEQQSGKHRKKWQKARHSEREAYVKQLSSLSTLRGTLYCEVFFG